MSLTLLDATHLSLAEIEPMWPDILACIEKYCARFAVEETPQNVIDDVASGERRMWLVLDEDGKVVLVPITTIETMKATGHTRLLLAECGGSRLEEAMPLLETIEQWAKAEHGAASARFIARKGWRDYLEPLGYRAKAIVYDKEL